MSETVYTAVTRADQLTKEILDAVESIHDGWYPEGRIDWEDFLDRLDGIPLEDGSTLDLGDNMLSEAIVAIKNHVRNHRNER